MIKMAVAKSFHRRKVGVAAAVLVMAGCAVGQNAAMRIAKPSSRRVLVSIPDRKPAVMDGETVVAPFPSRLERPRVPALSANSES
jgi:hypothetical protein